MEPCTVGAIALRPTGMRRMNQLARCNPKGLTFTDSSGQPIMAEEDTEEDHDKNYLPKLMTHTNNNDEDDEYYSLDKEDSTYKPEDEDNESTAEANADITDVDEDNIAA
eukprot:8242580-Ditylum_brightwellii.AAC.1